MIIYRTSSDASSVYRDTSAVSTIRMDRTGDTGSLVQVMRDAVVLFPMPEQRSEGKIPSHVGGDSESVAKR